MNVTEVNKAPKPMTPNQVFRYAAKLAFDAGLITRGDVQNLCKRDVSAQKTTQYFRVMEVLRGTSDPNENGRNSNGFINQYENFDKENRKPKKKSLPGWD